jgi:nucleotide-binding universal stress UspA family protein
MRLKDVMQECDLMGIVTTELLDTFMMLLEEQRSAPYTHILVPTDFGITAGHALHKAIRLARQQRAALTLLHVLPCPSSMLALDVDHISAEAAVHVFEDCQADALTRLAALIPRDTICPVDYHVASGETARVIVRIATHRQVDLIAMGCRRRRGWQRLLARNIPRQVVRQAPCPVLLVEEPARYELINTSG